MISKNVKSKDLTPGSLDQLEFTQFVKCQGLTQIPFTPFVPECLLRIPSRTSKQLVFHSGSLGR